MGEDKYTITIKKKRDLEYTVCVKEDNKGRVCNYNYHRAEKIDKRYLLRKDNSITTMDIFGIADDSTEADERLYKSAQEQVRELKETYRKLGKIKIIDMTKAGGIEERF